MREGEAVLTRPPVDRPRAATVLEEAHAIAARLGAEPMRRTVESLLGLAGRQRRRAGGSQPAGSPSPFELSAREREVLALVAAGRSDGEIAEALYISKKTASVHVANIKGKLGAASRVEIVLHAMNLGLVSPGVTSDGRAG